MTKRLEVEFVARYYVTIEVDDELDIGRCTTDLERELVERLAWLEFTSRDTQPEWEIEDIRD